MDDLARDYLVLALSIGRLEDGIVDAYYGPPELKAAAETRDLAAAELAIEAAALRERAARERDVQRGRWLDRQLVALETLSRRFAGEELPYLDEVSLCFDARPERTEASEFRAVHDRLDALLPPGPSLRDRVDERNRRLTVAVERLPQIIAWLIAEIRAACLAVFPAPDGESLTFNLVTGEPWSAYNWYEGDLRSRIEFNTDLPARAPELISLVTHEAFPGHHLEHAWKEARLVREQGRAESTVQLINTPEAYVSEGLAELGGRYVVDRGLWEVLFAGICERAAIELEPGRPQREWQISDTFRGLRPVTADAALMLHLDGRPASEVVAFVEEIGLRTREAAEKNVEFISHPLWRTYVFCYSGGQRLLGEWCAAAGSAEAQGKRFFRLLSEQLTPSGIAEELGGV
ncbi:MAG TPA: hypothetical protein VK992_01915 [Candidatus Caenarcaniphilales bacterium]|nr:hypothetical protein [Candidatus Caenarcaniphilales bacterium]